MGFGKTTLAHQLETELSAVVLSHDEYMLTLLGRNPSAEEFALFKDKVFELIWILAAKLLKTGVDVVIDAGAWSAKTRKEYQEKAVKMGFDILFHQLECPIDLAKHRVLERTQTEKSELYIDENCFESLLAQYQPISKDEGLSVVVHKGS